jgi:hypothetical protein
MYDACHGATFDLVSVATSTDGTDVRYVVQPGLTYAPTQTITVPNTWTETNSFTATLTNVPVNLSSIVMTRSAFLGESAVAPMEGSVDSPSSGVVSVTAAMVPGLGTRSQVELGLHSSNASGFQIADVRTGGAAATQGIDLAQQALPFIAGIPVETATGVSWDQLDTGTPDLRLVSWVGHWPDGARTDFVNWTIEDAGAGTSITLPLLPAAYSSFDPSKATGLVLGHASVEYIDVDRLQGYDDARPFGPNLDAQIDDLGLFVDMPLVRRVSRTALVL